MRYVFYILVLIFMTNCSSQANGEPLEGYREKALRYLVKERLQTQIHSIRFQRKRFFKGWHLTLFQKDSVDRSLATFQIDDSRKKISCGLYIREQTPTQLVINLIECKGEHADQLSGSDQYGLPLLTVAKQTLINF